ncbi:MAG TPA: hypothetical protein VFC63_09120 [Blastocatellia bacterium]|nr:hypothetical protein [Blastocatellia bacterium]
MSTQELLIQIQKLPLEDRLTLLEAISRGVHEELRPRRRVKVEEVRGIAKPDGPMPTDEELKEDYTRYLMEKYS